MSDMMTFPASVDEFMEQYKMTDTEHVYSNGTEYVPIYRMKQWFEHCRHQQFPVANVAPVRHGRWQTHYRSGTPVADGYVSTCCDMWNNRKSNYCPNCGAKMDGGDNDEAD